MAFRIRHRPGEYRRWRFGNSGTAARLGIQWPGNWTIELNHNNAHTHIVPHKDVSFRPFTASIFTYRNINPPPAEYMCVESNRGTGKRGTPRVNPGILWIAGGPARHFGRVADETRPRLRVARLRTWPPVATKFQRNSTFGHAPTTEYSGNHTSAVQSRVCSPDVVPVEIFDRAFLLLTGAALQPSTFDEIDISIVFGTTNVCPRLVLRIPLAECIAVFA